MSFCPGAREEGDDDDDGDYEGDDDDDDDDDEGDESDDWSPRAFSIAFLSHCEYCLVRLEGSVVFMVSLGSSCVYMHAFNDFLFVLLLL